MEIEETAWKGFRNLKPRRYKWRSGLNVLIGPNGSGKTNCLESFSFLTGWGAFPGNKMSSIINWESSDQKASLFGSMKGERSFTTGVSITSRVSLKADEKKVTYSELRNMLPSLVFLPYDINLIDGSPATRRAFLDKICVLSSPLYARRLAEYKQIIKCRTALLRRGASLAPTFLPMIHLGGWIWECRRQSVILLEQELKSDRELLPCPVSLQLHQHGSQGLEPAENNLAQAIKRSENKERYARSVVVGPHRDDIVLCSEGRALTASLSRGQKRRTVLALILAASRLIERQVRLKPVLFLDDITAELDINSRFLVGKTLNNTGWQVFVSATENPFPETESTLWKIEKGNIFEA